jgi:hypothetical protein
MRVLVGVDKRTLGVIEQDAQGKVTMHPEPGEEANLQRVVDTVSNPARVAHKLARYAGRDLSTGGLWTR